MARLVYAPNLTAALGTTEVFVPEQWRYPRGYVFNIAPASVRVTQMPNTLHIEAVTSETVTVTISPK